MRPVPPDHPFSPSPPSSQSNVPPQRLKNPPPHRQTEALLQARPPPDGFPPTSPAPQSADQDSPGPSPPLLRSISSNAPAHPETPSPPSVSIPQKNNDLTGLPFPHSPIKKPPRQVDRRAYCRPKPESLHPQETPARSESDSPLSPNLKTFSRQDKSCFFRRPYRNASLQQIALHFGYGQLTKMK